MYKNVIALITGDENPFSILCDRFIPPLAIVIDKKKVRLRRNCAESKLIRLLWPQALNYEQKQGLVDGKYVYFSNDKVQFIKHQREAQFYHHSSQSGVPATRQKLWKWKHRQREHEAKEEEWKKTIITNGKLNV